MVVVALTEAGEKITVGAMGESVNKIYNLKCWCSWMRLSIGMRKEVVISDLPGPPSLYRLAGRHISSYRAGNLPKQGDGHMLTVRSTYLVHEVDCGPLVWSALRCVASGSLGRFSGRIAARSGGKELGAIGRLYRPQIIH